MRPSWTLTKPDGTKLVKEVIPFNSNKNGFTLYTGVGIGGRHHAVTHWKPVTRSWRET